MGYRTGDDSSSLLIIKTLQFDFAFVDFHFTETVRIAPFTKKFVFLLQYKNAFQASRTSKMPEMWQIRLCRGRTGCRWTEMAQNVL